MDGRLVIGHIPFLKDKHKGAEIDKYLLVHKVSKFIVLDDDNNGVDSSLFRFGENLIVCNGDKGFTEKEFKEAKQILLRKNTYVVSKEEEFQK